MATLHEGFEYLLSCRPSHYVWWLEGEVSRYDGAPAWGVNAPAPDPSEVQARGGFCVAALTLMQRFFGVTIPNPFNDEAWDAGTYSTYHAYYHDSEWFDYYKDYPDGTVLCSPWDANTGAQGHVAVVCQGYCIEWTTTSGLVWNYTVQQSHEWGQYVIAIPPEVAFPLADGGGVAEPAPPPSLYFDGEMLRKAMTSNTWASPDIDPNWTDAYAEALRAVFKKYEINTRERISAFLAQIGHESGSLNWWREFGGENARYAPYYGRGPMQLTWSANYEEFANESGYDAWNFPDIVATTTLIGMESAGWFWYGHAIPHQGGDPVGNLNPWADIATWESFDWITEAINGGFNGKADRDARYAKAWNVIPDGVTIEEGEPVPVPIDPPPDPIEPVEPGRKWEDLQQWEKWGYYIWPDDDSYDMKHIQPPDIPGIVRPVPGGGEPEPVEWHRARTRVQFVDYRVMNGDVEFREPDGDEHTMPTTEFVKVFEEDE